MNRVSVIIPCYKSARFIEATIQSVLGQTHRDLEVICVDDCSPDNTAEIIQEIAARDSRVRYIRHEVNAGAPAAGRNTGLTQTTGEFVAFLDHDDSWEPTKLEKQLVALHEQSVDFLCCNIFMFNNITQKVDGTAWGSVVGSVKENFAKRLLKGNFVPPASTLIRRSVFEVVGVFDANLRGSDDFDMWYRIVRKFPAGVLNEPLATWRYKNAESISADDTFMVIDEMHFYEKFVGSDFADWELAEAKEGVLRNKKNLANRRLLAGNFDEARKLYTEAGFSNMARIVQLMPKLAQWMYRQKRAHTTEFRPIDVDFSL